MVCDKSSFAEYCMPHCQEGLKFLPKGLPYGRVPQEYTCSITTGEWRPLSTVPPCAGGYCHGVIFSLSEEIFFPFIKRPIQLWFLLTSTYRAGIPNLLKTEPKFREGYFSESLLQAEKISHRRRLSTVCVGDSLIFPRRSSRGTQATRCTHPI